MNKQCQNSIIDYIKKEFKKKRYSGRYIKLTERVGLPIDKFHSQEAIIIDTDTIFTTMRIIDRHINVESNAGSFNVKRFITEIEINIHQNPDLL